MIVLSEHVLEIRYKANPKILDHLGLWAGMISNNMELPEWEISKQNRVDAFDKENKNRAFVSYKNAGFVVLNTPTKNYFPDKAVKFLNYLMTLNDFEKTPYIERIGVRSRFCEEYKDSFDALKEKYSSNYLTLTEKAKNLISSSLLDIGGHLNFEDKCGKFNTMSGPMKKRQITQFFNKDFFKSNSNFPDVGLYFDIDYWEMPKRKMSKEEIVINVKKFASSAWKKFESISKLILEG